MRHHDVLHHYEWYTDDTENYQCLCGFVFQYLDDAEQHWLNHGGLEAHIMEARLR